MSSEIEVILPLYLLFFTIVCTPFLFYVKKENIRPVFDRTTLIFGSFFISISIIEALKYDECNQLLSYDMTTKIFLFSNTAILAPIAEEIFFRSHVISALEKFKSLESKKWIVFLFGIFSSFGWTYFHYEDNMYFFFSTFFIGMGLFFIRYKTKSIINCIALHSFSNSVGLVFMCLGV